MPTGMAHKVFVNLLIVVGETTPTTGTIVIQQANKVIMMAAIALNIK